MRLVVRERFALLLSLLFVFSTLPLVGADASGIVSTEGVPVRRVPGATLGRAVAINDAGWIALNTAVVKDSGELVDLWPILSAMDPVASSLNVTGLSDDGEVVGTYRGTTARSFLWSETSGMRQTGVPNATGMDHDGTIVGFLSGSNSYYGRPGAWDVIAVPSLQAQGMDNGLVVGAGGTFTPADGYRPLPGSGVAYDANASQIVVGHVHAPGASIVAAYWPSPTEDPVIIGTLPGDTFSQARAINDDGWIVGWSGISANGNDPRRAFLWHEDGGMVDLGFYPGDTTADAHDIDSAGVILGQSGFAPVLWEVGVAPPVDEPPTWVDATLTPTARWSEGFSIEWSGATDDVEIVSYEVLIGGAVVETVSAPETSATVSGLNPDTLYEVEVQALDGASKRSTDGPRSKISTTPALATSTLLPSPLDPSQAWQASVPTELLDLARTAEEVVLVTTAGSSSPKMTRLTPFVPTDIDLDDDGVDDARATIELRPGPGALPEVTLTVDRLIDPGPSAVQIVALIPLPPELATSLGQSTIVVGFGTTALDGGPGGTLPVSESIVVSLDSIEGLFHRFGLTFKTVGEQNPLEFYAGSAEGESRAGGAEAANLLGMHVSNPPPQVRTEVSIDATQIADPDPLLLATWSWLAPSNAADPDVTFAYLESDRRRRDTVADYDTRVFIGGMDPETSLTATLIPDDSLEVVLRHNDPSNDSPTGVVPDKLDAVEFRHERSDGLSLRAGFDDVGGRDLTLRLDDGTGELSVMSGALVDIEFEVSRPGRGFITGFSNPIDWLFASIQNTREVVVGTSHIGEVAVTFGSPSDVAALTFLAADDPGDLRFPTEQIHEWPSAPPQQWRYLSGYGKPQVRLGVADGPEGSTIALQTKDSTGFSFAPDPATLAQSIALGVRSNADLDIDVEFEPGSIVAEGVKIECSARVRAGDIGFEIEAPNRYVFRSAGGGNLDCQAGSRDRNYTVKAKTFPDLMTFDLTTPGDGATLGVVAEDRFGGEVPITEVLLEVRDDAGLTGYEPFGEPATYLAVGANSLPSSTLGWSRTEVTGTVIDFSTSANEDSFLGLRALLATKEDPSGELFNRPAGAEFDHVVKDVGSVEFLPDDQHSFRLWETPLSSILAGGADDATHASVHVDPTGVATVNLESTASRWLTTELGLPAGGHFTPGIAIEAWCRLRVPGATNQFVVDAPTTVAFATSSPVGFKTVECRNRIRNENLRTDVSVHAVGSGVADQTELLVDLRGGFAQLVAPIAPVESLSIDIIDETGDGLVSGTALSKPAVALSLRGDDAETFVSTWTLDPDRPMVDLRASQPVGSAQMRLSTNPGVDPIPDPEASHYTRFTDEGPDAAAEIAAGVLDLEHARFTMDHSMDLPLRVSVDSSAPHPLNVEILAGFDSPLAPVVDGNPVEVSAAVSISELTAATYTSDIQGTHRVTGADSADLTGQITIDDTDDDGHILTIDMEAKNLPRAVGVDAFGIISDPKSVSAIAELSGPLDSLDIVLSDERPTGVRETGSRRLRVRAEAPPTRMEFTLTGTGTEGDGPFSGDLRLQGALSSRLGRLLVESDRSEAEGLHFGTPFARLTAELVDVPRFTDITFTGDPSGSAFDASVVFHSTESIPREPGPSDRVGSIEFLLERSHQDVSVDRGTELLTYAGGAFTEVTRSGYVRSIDDNFWSSDVRSQLDSVDGRSFSLATTTDPEPLAADGEGAGKRTRAVDDAFIMSTDTRRLRGIGINDVRFVALHLSDVHSLDSSKVQIGETTAALGGELESFHWELRARRPAQVLGRPMYVAIEGDTRPWYEKFARGVSITPPSLEDRDPRIPDDAFAAEYGTADSSTGGYTLDVLRRAPDTVDPDTLSVFFQAAFGVVSVVDGEILYVPNDLRFVGIDDFIIQACSRDDVAQCALATVNVTIWETYTAGIYAKAESIPSDFTVHFDESILTLPDDSALPFDPETRFPAEVGLSSSDRPGVIDIFVGPRTLPPISSVPSTRLYVKKAPQDFRFDLSDPSIVNTNLKKLDLSVTFKVDTSGGVELIGMSDTSGDKQMWFGVAGEDVDFGLQSNGLIRHVLTGSRPEKEFRGCDRILGKIDTCITLIGVDIEADLVGDNTGEKISGFFSLKTLSETTAGSRRQGAAETEHLPFLTASLTDASGITGGAQLQLEPFCVLQCEFPPFDLDVDLRIRAKRKRVHLWDRGFDGAVVFSGITSTLLYEPRAWRMI